MKLKSSAIFVTGFIFLLSCEPANNELDQTYSKLEKRKALIPRPGTISPSEETLKGQDKYPAPNKVTLGHIATIYKPVHFNHASHVEYASSCSDCHHLSTEVEKNAPCRTCHRTPLASANIPGLKGAYHRQCMDCHRKSKGPLGCTECHSKAKERKFKGIENPPEVAMLYQLSSNYEPVKFNHALHVKKIPECKKCHHASTDIEKTPPCRSCHTSRETKKGEKKLGLKDAYHKQCKTCHGKGKKVVLGCLDCHPKKKAEEKPAGEGEGEEVKPPPPPITATIPPEREKIRLRVRGGEMPPVRFSHLKHSKDYGVECGHCHHMGGDDLTCTGCHKGRRGPNGEPSFKNAMHKNCIGCHREQKKGPRSCMSCHR